MRKKVLVPIILLMILLGFVLLSVSCVNSKASDGSSDEVNALKKFDPTLYYSKDEIDALLKNYYTQTETDNLLSFSLDDYYTRTETDNFLSQYYQQSEVDTLISNKKNTIIAASMELPANATYYVLYGSVHTIEDRPIIIAPVDGILTNFTVKQSLTMNGGSLVEVTVRVNYKDTLFTAQMTSADGTDVKSDSLNIIGVSRGDVISIRFREKNSVAPGTGSATHASFLFEAI
jgi:hypothetical protein